MRGTNRVRNRGPREEETWVPSSSLGASGARTRRGARVGRVARAFPSGRNSFFGNSTFLLCEMGSTLTTYVGSYSLAVPHTEEPMVNIPPFLFEFPKLGESAAGS